MVVSRGAEPVLEHDHSWRMTGAVNQYRLFSDYECRDCGAVWSL
jgi:hypothetical protein